MYIFVFNLFLPRWIKWLYFSVLVPAALDLLQEEEGPGAVREGAGVVRASLLPQTLR